MVANPRYNASVDEFSYGILMIHMFSRQWPEPQIGQVRTEPNGGMIPVSEAEWRKEFLLAVGNDHPLMDLILKCIHNHPKSRADASETGRKVVKMVLQFSISFANKSQQTERRREPWQKKERGMIGSFNRKMKLHLIE